MLMEYPTLMRSHHECPVAIIMPIPVQPEVTPSMENNEEITAKHEIISSINNDETRRSKKKESGQVVSQVLREQPPPPAAGTIRNSS